MAGSRLRGEPAASRLWTGVGAVSRRAVDRDRGGREDIEERKLGRKREKQCLSPLSLSLSLSLPLSRSSTYPKQREKKREKVDTYISKKEKE